MDFFLLHQTRQDGECVKKSGSTDLRAVRNAYYFCSSGDVDLGSSVTPGLGNCRTPGFFRQPVHIAIRYVSRESGRVGGWHWRHVGSAGRNVQCRDRGPSLTVDAQLQDPVPGCGFHLYCCFGCRPSSSSQTRTCANEYYGKIISRRLINLIEEAKCL